MFQKFGFSGDSEFFRQLGDHFDKGFFIISAVLGTVLLSVGSAFAGDFELYQQLQSVEGAVRTVKLLIINPYTTMFLGSIFLGMGAIGTYKDQSCQNERMCLLEKENADYHGAKSALNAAQEELQGSRSRLVGLHGELVQTWLKSMSKTLDLDSNSRVTIYYEHSEEFYLLERYSKNPTYAKVHRQKFPLNQGVISKAWEHEVHIEDSCPEAESYREYESYLATTYGYHKDKISSLAMKSCRYYARAIIDADVHVGVIVYESTDVDFLSGTLITSIDRYCAEYQGQLCKFVRDSLSFDPEVNIKREGKAISVENEIIEMLEGK